MFALAAILFGIGGFFLQIGFPGFFPLPVAKILLPLPVIGFGCTFLLVGLSALDWIVVGDAVERKWPRAFAQVVSVEIVSGNDNDFAIELRVTLPINGQEQEREPVLGFQTSWDKRSSAEKFLARRITNGRCEVAVEPGANGRVFLLPWAITTVLIASALLVMCTASFVQIVCLASRIKTR